MGVLFDHVSVYSVHAVPMEARGGQILRTGITDCCVCRVGAGNLTPVLCKSQCAELPSHFTSPLNLY